MAWSFLPGIATSWIQTIYYGLTIRAGDPKPTPGSPRHTSHRNTIHILVVATYLLYTIYEAHHDLRSAPSFYTELGIPVTAAEREIKSRFRRLAALHHPDKAMSGAGDAQASAAFFIHLKTASDTLQDAAKRYAYERFGPAMLEWAPRCVTVRDFVTHGVVYTVLPHYAMAAAAAYALGLFGYMDFARFYRWLLLATLCLLEVTLATTGPALPAPLAALNAVLERVAGLPPYLPFEVVHLARKVTLTVYIALSQIGPVFAAQLDRRAEQGVEDEDKALREGLMRLEGMTRQLDADAARLVDMELTPFKGDEEMVARMRGKMRDWLVNNTIRSDPMVKDALGNSFRKRRVDAPAGAKGNR
ncbi:Heat shock protein DnaJ [Cordyceps fumosorosea ARSEF 2679]|uniref:Heat shock protein DnaJ n=1 Tax=Cordyceps fumosorosea (strain ARSEF 2679) TaxID=1081104 RepID=A0A168B4X6_CORFA|nr:Heat shock protein DnaJ [Cordyceps fumosorosea ARSEF 2679]OAA69623.1 Heat shock protein DnaJ [Cordyceps fumosorosea ARSEF 2679]